MGSIRFSFVSRKGLANFCRDNIQIIRLGKERLSDKRHMGDVYLSDIATGEKYGIVSLGNKPAFARALVQIPGQAARISVARLETAKRTAPKLHDIFVRYADCLTAQVLQSVGCATIHPLEARCARWLLMAHDRRQQPEIPLTQEALAEMFGVARTYMTRVASALQRRGAISYRRGIVRIEHRAMLRRRPANVMGPSAGTSSAS